MSKVKATFNEPFLADLKDALETAISISWEGCHKIYIAMDQQSHEGQIECGYHPVMVSDKEKALDTLYEWWEAACGLRFISAISENNKFKNLIGQFAYDENEENTNGDT